VSDNNSSFSPMRVTSATIRGENPVFSMGYRSTGPSNRTAGKQAGRWHNL